jgi:hypothetical protein
MERKHAPRRWRIVGALPSPQVPPHDDPIVTSIREALRDHVLMEYRGPGSRSERGTIDTQTAIRRAMTTNPHNLHRADWKERRVPPGWDTARYSK